MAFKVITEILIRESGTGGGIYVGDKDDPSYSDWIYGDPVTDNDYMLYVIQLNQNKNLYLKRGPSFFGLFQMQQQQRPDGVPVQVLDGGAPSDIRSKGICDGHEAPLAGNTPDTARLFR
jgi:hypothetical protein